MQAGGAKKKQRCTSPLSLIVGPIWKEWEQSYDKEESDQVQALSSNWSASPPLVCLESTASSSSKKGEGKEDGKRKKGKGEIPKVEKSIENKSKCPKLRDENNTQAHENPPSKTLENPTQPQPRTQKATKNQYLLSPRKVGETGEETGTPISQKIAKTSHKKQGKGYGGVGKGNSEVGDAPTNQTKSTIPPTSSRQQPDQKPERPRAQPPEPKRPRAQPPSREQGSKAIEVHEAQGSTKPEEQEVHVVDDEGRSTKGTKMKPRSFEQKKNHPHSQQKPLPACPKTHHTHQCFEGSPPKRVQDARPYPARLWQAHRSGARTVPPDHQERSPF
jgi:hypothetical protein